jgi:hypothetical protein
MIKHEDFIIYKHYRADNPREMNYSIQTRQRGTSNAGLTRVTTRYPEAHVVFRIDNIPNSKNLFARVKRASSALVSFERNTNSFNFCRGAGLVSLEALVRAENAKKTDLDE